MRRSASQPQSTYLYAIIILCGLASLGFSEVQVDRNANGKLLYRLEKKSILTDKAKKELQSGLNTQLLILAKLENGDNPPVAEQVKKISIRYDLWEEKYWMEIAAEKTKTSFSNLSEVVSWIEAPGPFTWMAVSDLKSAVSYKLEVLETLNPVSQDRLEEIQKWMIQQRLSSRVGGPDGNTEEISLGSETPFTALFYDLWKKAAAGELAGEIQRQEMSSPFRSDTLAPKEGRR